MAEVRRRVLQIGEPSVGRRTEVKFAARTKFERSENVLIVMAIAIYHVPPSRGATLTVN